MGALTSDLQEVFQEASCRAGPPVQHRFRFETILAKLSAAFIHLPPSKVDSQIQSALRQIVEFLGVDRGALAEVLVEPRQVVITHSYHLPGVLPQPRTIVTDEFPWYARAIQEGEVLRLARLPDDLPAAAARERQYCIEVGLKSHVMIPLKMMDSVVGAIGFGLFTRYRDWPEELIQRLRLVGEVFANALAQAGG